jgi:RloB-like protein
MAARRTRAKDLKRRVANRVELKTIVVYCEGEASEPDYINGLKRLPHVRKNASITIEIDTRSGVPLTLAERAVDRKLNDDEVDEIWCVFDVEAPRNHPNLAKAVQLAADYDINLAISNPCFELWLILHFEDQTAFMTTSAAERRSRQIDGRKGKRIDAGLYLDSRRAAAQRALSLMKRHEADGTVFPEDNPSSSMYALLASIDPEIRVSR